MITVVTVDNQTIYDLAVQHYGNVGAVGEILRLNPELENDLKGMDDDREVFNFYYPVKGGSVVVIDMDSDVMNKSIVKEIVEPVTTFEVWQEQ